MDDRRRRRVTERSTIRRASRSTRHSLRLLPSELLLLGPADKQPESRFVGIGDPIYNAADSRLRPGRPGLAAGLPEPDASEISLARLVGSAKEIRTSAN